MHREGMKSLQGSKEMEENTHLLIHGGAQCGFNTMTMLGGVGLEAGGEEQNMGCTSTCGNLRSNFTQEGHLIGLT